MPDPPARCPTCGSLTPQLYYGDTVCRDRWHKDNDRCPTCGNTGRGEVYGTCPDSFHLTEPLSGHAKSGTTPHMARPSPPHPDPVSTETEEESAMTTAERELTQARKQIEQFYEIVAGLKQREVSLPLLKGLYPLLWDDHSEQGYHECRACGYRYSEDQRGHQDGCPVYSLAGLTARLEGISR